MAISEFKARCLEVLKQVKRTGQPVVITRHGEPIAQITRPASEPRAGSWLGAYVTTGRILGDVIESAVEPETWAALSDDGDGA